jgi:hypothetical protein
MFVLGPCCSISARGTYNASSAHSASVIGSSEGGNRGGDRSRARYRTRVAGGTRVVC